MSAAGVVTVQQVTAFTAEVRGDKALRLLRKVSAPVQFTYRPLSGGKPCWQCPAPMIPDLLAASEVMRGVRVVLEHEQEALL